MAILGQAQFTITDLHDAIITGTAPDNPAIGALWIDTSVTPNILKSWNGTAWVDQSLDLDGIDPAAGQQVTNATTNLSNLADDSIITQSERSYIKDKVTAVIGYIIGDTAQMPDITTIDAGNAGDAYSVRRQAVLAGLVTTNASYIDVATQYTNLANYLNAMTPLPWNTSDTGTVTIVPSDWRDKWNKYYEAVYNLQELVANQASVNAANAQAAAEGYANQTQQYSVRYIRDWLNGSTSNASNHWVEITAMAGTTNRALSKTITSNATLTNPAYVTDGSSNSANWTGTSGSGLQYVQIDLGAVYQDINYIQVWHYYTDSRTYHNTKLEVSSNGVDWVALFDSASSGEYIETATGRTTLVNAGNALAQAQSDATAANASISDMSNDNKLTASEKSDLLKEWNIIQGEKPYMDGQADTYSITTEKTTYDNAYNTLNTYVPPLVSSLSTTSTIDGPTFRTNFTTYYNAKAALQKKVNDAAKAYTDSASTTAASTVASALTVDNTKSTYFPFNNNLLSTNGLNPSSGYIATLRVGEGRFGGAVAVEESRVNLLASAGTDTFFTSTAGITLNNGSQYTSDIEASSEALYGGSVLKVVDADGNTTTSLYGGVNLPTLTGLTNLSYTMTIRFKVVGWTTGSCAVWSHIKDSTNVQSPADKPDDYSIPNTYYDGQWHIYSVTRTQLAGYDQRTMMIGMNLTNLGCTMYVDAIQFEVGSNATSFYNGTRAAGKLSYVLPNIPSDHSLLSYRRTIMDTSYTHWALTKSGSTFNYYENGAVTTSYKNKWVAYEMAGAATAKNNDFTRYTQPIAKQYFSDFSPPSHNLSTQPWGWYMKTYVYSTAAVTVWHRYAADNYGSIRVNNGTVQNVGGYMSASVNSTNPDVRIDLVPGWNLVEMCYMDGDTGGGLSLQKNTGGQNLTGPDSGAGFVTSTPLSQVTQVIYMTAELPVEFSSNTVYFNEKSNILIDEAAVSSRIFTGTEISAIYGAQTYFTDPVPKVLVPAPSSVTMTLS